MRRTEIAVPSVGLGLRRLGEEAENQGVAGGQRQHPAARRAAARHLHHLPDEGRHVAFVAAEAARLDDAVEAGRQEVALGRRGQSAERLALALAQAQRRAQRLRPRQEIGRRQPRLGRRDGGRGTRHQPPAAGPAAPRTASR